MYCCFIGKKCDCFTPKNAVGNIAKLHTFLSKLVHFKIYFCLRLILKDFWVLNDIWKLSALITTLTHCYSHKLQLPQTATLTHHNWLTLQLPNIATHKHCNPHTLQHLQTLTSTHCKPHIMTSTHCNPHTEQPDTTHMQLPHTDSFTI